MKINIINEEEKSGEESSKNTVEINSPRIKNAPIPSTPMNSGKLLPNLLFVKKNLKKKGLSGTNTFDFLNDHKSSIDEVLITLM